MRLILIKPKRLCAICQLRLPPNNIHDTHLPCRTAMRRKLERTPQYLEQQRLGYYVALKFLESLGISNGS